MVLAAALGLEPRTPTFRVWCATNCTTRQSGKAYLALKMRARRGGQEEGEIILSKGAKRSRGERWRRRGGRSVQGLFG